LRLLARLWRRLGCPGDERDEPLARVGAVALLRAEARRLDDDDALLGRALSGELQHVGAHTLGKAGRAGGVEAKLHGGRNLVDVLPAGAGSADEAFFQLVLADLGLGGDAQPL